MSIKNKIRLGIGFLYVMSIGSCFISIFYIHQLVENAKLILKDNYESIQYIQQINRIIDQHPDGLSQDQYSSIEKNVQAQEHNITEIGEKALTDSLRIGVSKLLLQEKKDPIYRLNQIRKWGDQIVQLNMAAIEDKNSRSIRSAGETIAMLTGIGTIFFLISFIFWVNFPEFIAKPINELIARVKEISNRNYHQTLPLAANDEFGELRREFNRMTQKLAEFENSNMADLIIEKKRVETIINTIDDVILGLNERSEIVFINQTGCGLLGMTESELIGRYAPDIALYNDLLRNLIQDKSSNIHICVGSKERVYSKEILPVQIEHHEIGKLIILKNITQFQALDKAKTNFMATISHELKTPISSIKMSLKLLEDSRIGLLNLEQKHLIENMEEDTVRLMNITKELLDIAQVEEGKITLHFSSTHPKTIVDFAMQAIQLIADQKNVLFDLDIEKNLPPVRADLEKSTWVLINILSNAIKYSYSHNSIKISIHLHSQNRIEFEVRDFGIGIAQEHLSRIFDRYFQVPNSLTAPTGTGLGLAIAKEFIEAQQGTISISSEIGQGTSVHFLLPVA